MLKGQCVFPLFNYFMVVTKVFFFPLRTGHRTGLGVGDGGNRFRCVDSIAQYSVLNVFYRVYDIL